MRIMPSKPVVLVALGVGAIVGPMVALAACWKNDAGWPCPSDPPVSNCYHQLVTDSLCFTPTATGNGENKVNQTATCQWEWRTLDAEGECTVTHPLYTENRACYITNGTSCSSSGGGQGEG